MAPRSRLTSQTEQLIAEVKKYPCLYALDKAEYRDPVLKYECWKEISKKLNRDTSVLRKNWKNLRDCCRQALITRKSTRKRSTKLKPWRFEKQMSFVKPYLGPKSCSVDTAETSCPAGTTDDSALDVDDDDDDDDRSKFSNDGAKPTTAPSTISSSTSTSVVMIKHEPGDNPTPPSPELVPTELYISAARCLRIPRCAGAPGCPGTSRCPGASGCLTTPHVTADSPSFLTKDPVVLNESPSSRINGNSSETPLVVRLDRECQTSEPPVAPRQQVLPAPELRRDQQPIRQPYQHQPNRQQPCGCNDNGCNRPMQWEPSTSDLELFFVSMFQSTKKLPRCYQSKVKREVLNTVLRAEEEYEQYMRNGTDFCSIQNRAPDQIPHMMM